MNPMGVIKHITGMVCVALLFIGCGRSEQNVDAFATPETRMTHVVVHKVLPDTLVQYSNLSATAVAWREVALGFQEAGKVVAVHKDMGSVVKAGTPLARLDVALLEAALAEAEAGKKLQHYTYEGAKQLYAEGSISEQDFYSAEFNYKKAETTYLTLKKRLENAVLQAPFAGTVVARYVELGQQVQVGYTAFDLVQTERIRMKAWLPENEILGIQKGSKAHVTIDAYPNQTFTGQVMHIGPSATTSQRVFPLEVHLENEKGLLRPGMLGKMKLIRQRLEGVVVLPRAAVLERELGPVVFVRQNNKAEKRNVRLGVSEGSWVVVEEGVTFGEEIIIRGGRELIDGDLIQVQEGHIQ